MDLYHEKLSELLAQKVPFVSVILVDTAGSVPQDAGTKMIVTRDGLHYGTVGGGKVENKAIQEALSMLEETTSAADNSRTRFVNWSLSRDVGMTCGGAVKLYFEKYNVKNWLITVFGAGHVANAVVRLLVDLECRITCIDPRPEWLEKLPDSPKLKAIHSETMPEQVQAIPEDSFVLLLTMGHSTDSPILIEILKTRRFPYIGVIGSRAKAERLRQDIEAAGLPDESMDRFFCPVGLAIGSNHPQEIAISIVAQLLQVRS